MRLGSGHLDSSGAEPRLNEPERTGSRRDAAADLRLAAAVRDGDRKAAAELVGSYADAVYAYVAHRLFPDRDQTDDLVQDVFLSAFQGIDSYTGSAPLQSWLLGIARHKIDDHYRRVLRAARLDDADAAEIPSTEDVAELVSRTDTRKRTLRTLGRIRAEYRLLLQWRYWDLKSAAEMAALTGKTEKAIERMLARARQQFRTLWEDENA